MCGLAGLYLLVTPKGGRCWRYAYKFAKKYKQLSLGTYPVVTLEWAGSRHEFARNLLANGVDPAALKAAIGEHAFVLTKRLYNYLYNIRCPRAELPIPSASTVRCR